QRLQQRRLQQSEMDAEEPESEPGKSERERHRIADQQEHHQPAEHDRRQVFGEHQAACPFFSNSVAGTRPRRKPTRLMISETPCSASSPKATGISNLTGQRISPPGSEEYSWMS